MHWLLIAVLAARACAQPHSVRVDLHDAQVGSTTIFITLDVVTGVSPNVSLSWSLPPAAAAQTSYSLLITAPTSAKDPLANRTVLSRTEPGSAPMASFPRTALSPATPYDAVVSVTFTNANGSSVVTGWSAPLRFHTSAGAAEWATAAPVWAPKCGGAPGPKEPSFAAFTGTLPVALPAGSDGILAAYIYATAAPPIYNDPWCVRCIARCVSLAFALAVEQGRGRC